MNVELHLGTELCSGAKLQNEVEAHSNIEISVHEREVHSDLDVERQYVEVRVEPRLFKYVKRHHTATQIIGDRCKTNDKEQVKK